MLNPVIVLTTVNAPYSKKLSGPELAHCLTDQERAKAEPAHMYTFLGDVQPELQCAFAAYYGITYAQLVTAAKAFASHSGASFPLAT
ncbi:MAG TPA: hypothetical protein VH678_10555 [Xanthobacteraceae bacterium]